MKAAKKYLAKFTPQVSIELPEDWNPGKDADWDTALPTVAEALDKLSWRQLTDLLLENIEEIVPDTDGNLSDTAGDAPEAMLQKLNLQRLSIQWQMRELIAKHNLTVVIGGHEGGGYTQNPVPSKATDDNARLAELGRKIDELAYESKTITGLMALAQSEHKELFEKVTGKKNYGYIGESTPLCHATDSEHTAERNGHAAWVQFVASKMQPNCPYPKGSVQEVAWRRGWNKG